MNPVIKLVFEIPFEFKAKLYKEIETPPGISIKTWIDFDYFKDKNKDKNKDEDEEDFDYDKIGEDKEEEDEIGTTKLIITVISKGEVSLAINAGMSIGVPNIFTFSILTGIQGLLGSGKIGFSLELGLTNLKKKIDSFYIIEAFSITFFLKFKFEINLFFTKTEFEIFIFQVKLKGLEIEKHNIEEKSIMQLIYMTMALSEIKNNMLT